MKKLLSMLGTITLIGTTSTSVIACNNIPVIINTINFKLMDGIKQSITLAIDSKDNLYTSDKKGNIYKCLAGENEFKKFAVININTNYYNKFDIKIDNDSNIYVIVNADIYKCLASKNTFQKIFSCNEDIWSTTIDKANNIYAGGSDGILYKCLAGENIFNEVTTIQRPINSIVIDENNNIFLLSTIWHQDSEIYQCLASENIFNKIYNINNVFAGSKLLLDSNNDIYIGITTINGKGNIYKCLKDKTSFIKIAEIQTIFVNFTIDNSNNIYVIDNAGSVYKILANDDKIIKINNQISINNNTIITDQKNKIYISNYDYGVYKSE